MKSKINHLATSRLCLRALRLSDAEAVRRLVRDKAIARTTLSIPHPYKKGMAEKYIKTSRKASAAGQEATWAICLKSTRELIGSVSLLHIDRQHCRAEIGYWIGRPYWKQGYATEAAEAVLRYGFRTLKLKRIFGHHFANNPASGRIMKKIGMRAEGTLRRHIKKWGRFIDLETRGILFEEWHKKHSGSRRVGVKRDAVP